MNEAALPVDLEPGEWLLQWSVSSPVTTFGIVARRARLWLVLSAIVAAFTGLCAVGCLRALDGVLPAWAGLLLLAPLCIAIFALPLVVVGLRSAPRRWWVTSRRLVLGGRAGPTELRLRGFESMEIDGPYSATVRFDGEEHTLRTAIALPELWGSLLLGRALCPLDLPPIDVTLGEPSVSDVVPWHATGKRGTVSGSGILVLQHDQVAWLPITTVDLGDRLGEAASRIAGRLVGLDVRVVRPVPPVDPLFHRLLRVRERESFDTALADIVSHWGGFVRPGGQGVEVTSGRRGDTVRLTVGETVYEAKGVDHPGWADVRTALGL